MLTDAEVERWSRQILVPEVGGRGQERLRAARVAVAGSGRLAFTVELLRRAGVGAVFPADDARAINAADVVLDLVGDPMVSTGLAPCACALGAVHVVARREGAWGAVAALTGRPCGACVGLERGAAPPRLSPALDAPATLAIGALAASETLRALWLPATSGRLHTIDLAAGRFHGVTVVRTAGCAVCAGSA